MKVLAIGNSFSVDAFTWLNLAAQNQGCDIVTGVLYIGGCPLEKHAANIIEGGADYEFYKTGRDMVMSSIEDALRSDDWDAVTTHQVSQLSGIYDTYQPYLHKIHDFVSRICPKAEFIIEQTWAYEKDSSHPGFANYDRDQAKMHAALSNAYAKAAEAEGVRLVPSGNAFQIAREMPIFDYGNGGISLNRDGFHAGYTGGRYMLSLVWLEMLTGLNCLENTFVPVIPDKPELTPNEEQLKALRTAAHAAVTGAK